MGEYNAAGNKVIIEKSHSGIFLWNRNWHLGWIWAGLATFEAGFFMFTKMDSCTVNKVIIEKSRGGRFLWIRNWDLGWIWAGLATFEAGKKKTKNTLDDENIFGIEWS